ncbi:MAG: TetR/AcrR family transcriptional regulator [Roseiflexaceae bacterium]|nr:TetR/AcrR family transcriptional regulator [Roseiflexaceae bacterium]
MDTRRDRQRAALTSEIKSTAQRLMAEHGTAGVSLRLIARELGMSAPSLYHYYASYDALITALLVDAFNALADELERHTEGQLPAAQRVLNVTLAFRSWALRHPIDFQLIYGNPIPGYQAPRELTVPAVVRSYTIIAQLLEAALAGSEQHGTAEFSCIPETVAAHLAQMKQENSYDISSYVLHATLVLWTRMYGCVMLELYNHLQASVGDTDAFYRAQMIQSLRAVGVELASP